MKLGYFFERKHNPSISEIPIFVYSSLKDEFCNNPIYLVLTKNNIEIYFHGYSSSGRYSGLDHKLILRLPLSNDKFHLSEFSNIIKQVTNNEDFKLNEKWTLDESLAHNYHNYFHHTEVNETNYIHRIILDFLFEFYNSELFQNMNEYELILSNMNSNLVLNAIYEKAEYNYIRKIFLVEYENEDNVNNFKEIYSKLYFERENRYLNVLLNSDFYRYINKCGNWFDNIESELKRIYLENYNKTKRRTFINNVLRMLNDPKAKLEFENSIQYVSNWFRNRYSIFNAFNMLRKNTVK